MKNKTAVIGGGASGLVAAIFAARGGSDVTILEKNSRLGKKILSTGNGRCNLSNSRACEKYYHGKNTSFINHAENTFWVKETLDFFSNLGLLIKEEDNGKLFPYSNQASSVLDVLRFEVERLGISVIYDFEASKLIRTKNGYKILSYSGDEFLSSKVIVSCGGKSAPDTGSNGSGFDLAKMTGHSVTPLSPSLVQIKTEPEFVKNLKGIKLNARVTLGNTSHFGEMLFTDYGLSGPPIFSISSVLSETDEKYISLDFMPEYDLETIKKMLIMRKPLFSTLENYFTGMLNKRLGNALFKANGISPLSRNPASLSDSETDALALSVKNTQLKILGTNSWNNAQTTSGGVDTIGINPKTMESLYNENLYFCGEIIDIDGDCGGFNLQWAWSSGAIAGKNAAAK